MKIAGPTLSFIDFTQTFVLFSYKNDQSKWNIGKISRQLDKSMARLSDQFKTNLFDQNEKITKIEVYVNESVTNRINESSILYQMSRH